MTFVLCLSLLILQATHDQISKLTYLACGLTKREDATLQIDLVRLAVFGEISAWIFAFNTNYLFAVLSAGALAAKCYKEQKEFGRLDRGSKSKRDKTYIYSAGVSQSQWANDQKYLVYIPKFINSRHITCLTLVESTFLLYACYRQPEDGAIFMAVTIACHYITDALDGGLGRYRNEGYVMWGAYCDHLFDALYESACMIALWMMMNHEKATNELASIVQADEWFGPICLILMNLFVLGFHSKEVVSFQKKLASHYSNLAAGMPLHYIEWFCIVYLLVMQFRGYSPTWNACLVIVWLSGGIFFLAAWHIKVWRSKTK
jgi:phosphatidylglycerophosphate synthase